MEKWEYGIMVQPAQVPLPEVVERMDIREAATGLTQGVRGAVNTASNALDTPEMEGWEIVSHSFLLIGTVVFITFLIRRKAE